MRGNAHVRFGGAGWGNGASARGQPRPSPIPTGSTTALEIDHIEDWAKTFRTKLGSLCWLCTRHHRDKTHKGWRLQGQPGSRQWLLPEKAASRSEAPGPEPPAAGNDGEEGRLFDVPPAA